MIDNVFIELSIIVVLAVLVSLITRFLRQPMIIGYLVTGILISPQGFDVIKSADAIATFAQIGVVLLLFLVGLNLSPKVIKKYGKVSLLTGLGQVVFTSLIGFLIAKGFGFSNVISFYVAVALTFSSTIIITKLLSDKGDMETLHGRIAIGFLIVQDIIAIVLLLATSSNGLNVSYFAFQSVFKGVGLVAVVGLLSLYVLPGLTNYIAKSREFLFLFSIGWCLAVASLFYLFNLSIEAGALVAGIGLSLSPYNFEIGSRLRPLRDFFIFTFFIMLGTQVSFSALNNFILPILVFSLFVLVGNPVIMMVVMGLLGYTKKTSFMTGLISAQISEFSFIFIATGVSAGIFSGDVLSFVTIVGLITIAGSTYFVMYDRQIYSRLKPLLTVFEKRSCKIDETGLRKPYDVIVVGSDRIGRTLVRSAQKISKNLLVIDFNPEVIASLRKQGVDSRYGDAGDDELWEELNLKKVKMLVSTIHDLNTDLYLIKKIKAANKKAIIITVAHGVKNALMMYKFGASYVITPHLIGGHHTATLIEKHALDFRRFLKTGLEHSKRLRNH